jgi:hypothetical protein
MVEHSGRRQSFLPGKDETVAGSNQATGAIATDVPTFPRHLITGENVSVFPAF